MTPEENRKRLAQERAGATPRNFKKGAAKAVEMPISAQDALYAIKLSRQKPGTSGRKARPHGFGATSRPGVRQQQGSAGGVEKLA